MSATAVSSNSTSNGALPTFLSPDAILQLRYTELLEKRIAQLESVIESSSKAVAQATSVHEGDANEATNGDGETKDENAVGGKAEGGKTEDGKVEAKGEGKASDTAGGEKESDSVLVEVIPKTRYRNVIRQFDKKTGIHADIEVGGLDQKKAKEGEVAFIFRKTLPDEPSDNNTYSEVDVEAAGLRILLKECIGPNYPGQNFDGDTVNLPTPFAPLVHNWEKLEKAIVAKPDGDQSKRQARIDLEKLLECVQAAPELEKYFKSRESNLGASITTYETMWTLFAPGTKIVAKLFMNQAQIMEVSRSPIPRSNPPPRDLKLLAWCWDWNGKEMVKVYYWLKIEQFWGTKPVNQLFCYPLNYHKDGSEKEKEELCSTLRIRGSKYNKIVRSKAGATQMYIYDGVALSERRSVIKTSQSDTDNTGSSVEDDERLEKTRRKQMVVTGAFLVDPEAFLQFGSDSQMLGENDTVWTGELDSNSADALRATKERDPEPSSEELLLFPPRLLGYSTKEKIWGQFGVDQTDNVPAKNTSLFEDKLQLDPNYKSMIQALVEQHGERGDEKNSDKVKVKDVVDDKGKGLVLLFHGPPGVGKTLTAETIAEATGKPLFVVSVAEIGLDASKAERNLEQMFYLAGKWEAVLLVDEADVFLESRTSNSDPNRNALVSVLLRVLEYYDGIMILTTNRITSLDIAVQSRIHLAIRYDDLTRPQKVSVFEMFLKQLKPDSIHNFKEIMEFVSEYGSDNDLNGRQIRNVVSSALSLARSLSKTAGGDARLTVRHLKQVLNITKDFQKQLESITTDTRAANEAARGKR